MSGGAAVSAGAAATGRPAGESRKSEAQAAARTTESLTPANWLRRFGAGRIARELDHPVPDPSLRAGQTGHSRRAVFTAGGAQLPYERVALVLQGGGALGSYQAGVYEGLAEIGVHPTWVAGISIGALNSAIIAGNAPADRVDRLRGFWETITQPGWSVGTSDFMQSLVERLDGDLRRMANGFEAWRAIVEGQRGFFYPRVPPPLPGSKLTPDLVSYYDTSVLKSTLERFADFDRINAGEMRVSVSAVDVGNGNVRVFDSKFEKLLPEHFMASGALPPGFPAIHIDGRYYWDGGLVTNTPLYPVLLDQPRADTLVFQVDLFSAIGALPMDLAEGDARRKDIMYSSRTRSATQYMEDATNFRHVIRELLQRIPPELRDDAWCREAAKLVERKQYNVIHLIYRSKPFEGESKDYEFSPVTMRDHWRSGLTDFRRTRSHPEWFDLPEPETEYVTHDIHRRHRGGGQPG